MKYIDAIKGSALSVLVFAPMVFVYHGIGPTPVIETILTVSSFLFAILAGFFISRLNSRYNEIRELISNEDAFFYSLFKTSKLLGDKFATEIGENIDKYYITAFEGKLDGYYKETR